VNWKWLIRLRGLLTFWLRRASAIASAEGRRTRETVGRWSDRQTMLVQVRAFTPRIAVILLIAGPGAYIAAKDPLTLTPFVLGVAWAILSDVLCGPSAGLGGTITRGLAVEWALAVGALAVPGWRKVSWSRGMRRSSARGS
jgi:hypothetical protein